MSTLRLMKRLLRFSWNHSVALRGVTDQMAVLLSEPLAAEVLAPLTGTLTLASSESASVRTLTGSVGALLNDPMARPLVRSSIVLARRAVETVTAHNLAVTILANDVEQLLGNPASGPLVVSSLALASRSVTLAHAHPSQLTTAADQLRQLVNTAEPLVDTAVPASALTLASQLLAVAYTYRDLVVDLNTHVGLVLNQGPLVGSTIPLMKKIAKAVATQSQPLVTLNGELATLLDDPNSIALEAGSIDAVTELARLVNRKMVAMTSLTIAFRDLLKDPPADPLETSVINLTTKLLKVTKDTSSDLANLTDDLAVLLSPTPGPTVFTLTRKSAQLFLQESAQLLTLLEHSPGMLTAVGAGMVKAGQIGIDAGGTVDAIVRTPIGKAATAIDRSKTEINDAVNRIYSVARDVSSLSVPTDVDLTGKTNFNVWVPDDPLDPFNIARGRMRTLTVPAGADFTGTNDSVPLPPVINPVLQPLTDAYTALVKLEKWVDPIVAGLYGAGADAKDAGGALQRLATAIGSL